jgi:uncharacterized protein
VGKEIVVVDLEFNVAQLMKEPVGAHRSYDFVEPSLLLSEPINEDDAELVADDVRGRIKFTKLNGRLRAEGAVQAAVALRCSRCLEEFRTAVQAPLDEMFMQTYDVTSGLPMQHGEGEDEEAFTIDRNHIVDLSELIRQTLLVSLPLQPLCREACAGLCPQCGKNWNEGPCDCPTETLDPRFSALASLLDDEETAHRFSNN